MATLSRTAICRQLEVGLRDPASRDATAEQLGAACSPSRDSPDRRQQALRMTRIARFWLQKSICATSHSRTQERVEPGFKLARSLHLRTRWPCDRYGGGSDPWIGSDERRPFLDWVLGE